MGSSGVNLGHARHQHLCRWGPGAGGVWDPNLRTLQPPRAFVGGCSIAHARPACNTICATPGPRAWAPPGLLSQAEMPMHGHGHVCPWHHCTHTVTHSVARAGGCHGHAHAQPGVHMQHHGRCKGSTALRQTSSGTQRPRGTHLHKQHSSSFPTSRGADKQPHSHPCISSRLPLITICAQRECAVRRAPICACPLCALISPSAGLCWGRVG